ncbi:MAG: DivIVA domain-containing protein [Defluviitaleaceae bacterium]|nr:DivIVA domain-containing protein [Defluviitaleaceae bacterium]
MEQFTFVKRGYDPDEVDRYIATLEQVVKSYKEKDNAIKNAIISAQIAADNMLKNAKYQADEYKAIIARELSKVTEQVEHQRMKVKAFQDVYAGLVQKYLTELDSNDIDSLLERLDELDRLIERLKEVDIVPPTSGDLIPPPTQSMSTPPPMPTPPAPPAPLQKPAEQFSFMSSATTPPPPPRPPMPPAQPKPMEIQTSSVGAGDSFGSGNSADSFSSGSSADSFGSGDSFSSGNSFGSTDSFNSGNSSADSTPSDTPDFNKMPPPTIMSKFSDDGTFVPNIQND